jgi:hypothetical protein
MFITIYRSIFYKVDKLKIIPVFLIFVILLVACSSNNAQITIVPSLIQPTPPIIIHKIINTQTSLPVITITPGVTKTTHPTNTQIILVSPTETPTPVLWQTQRQATYESAKATIQSYGTICSSGDSYNSIEISPDTQWIAMPCEDNNDFIDSYLQVVNTIPKKEWNIPIKNFAKGKTEIWSYPLKPYRWSSNGKYLFFAAGTRASGCCWIGGALFLARLNLETGDVAEIFNFITGDDIPGLDFSISSDDRYVIYSIGNQMYLLDMLTWNQKLIELKFGNWGYGVPLMSSDDNEILMVYRYFPEDWQSKGDITYGSMILIDLLDGTQRKIFSGYQWEDTPVPYKWIDSDHILLCTSYYDCGPDTYDLLLLDKNTGEMTHVNGP